MDSVKEERCELIHKWREERKRKLMARLFRNNPLGPTTTSSPLSSAILGIKPSASASVNTSSQQKSYQQLQKSNNFRKSLVMLKDGKGRVEKRHTMNPATLVNTQTLHRIGKSVQNQNNCFQKNKDIMAKDSRMSIMKKYDEDRKQLMRRTLAAIENTKSTLQNENNKGNDVFDTQEDIKNTQNVDELQVLKDNNSKDELNDGNAAGTDGITGEDLNTTFTLPNGESLSPIRGTNQDSAMTGGTRRLSSTPLKSTTPEEKHMSEKLSSWLKTKGKSIEGFPHLKCFLHHKKGSAIPIRQPFKVSNSGPLRTSIAPKPRPTNLPAIVIETIQEEQENSRGDLTIDIENAAELPRSPTKDQDEAASADCNPADETTVVLDSANLKETTVKALHELLTLIHTGYPWESCKEWLTALRSRNPDVESLPDYWECLAALEEVQGDMQMAVDSYQRALMRGAEVSHIDTCLDSLFEKMNALNLECQPYTPRQMDGKKKPCVDAKNIFKSSVIQFALLQQKVKTFSSESGVGLNNLNYIATPVRRSTRQSLFTSKTPQKCTSSIKSLMTEEKENVQFKPNKALLFDD